MKKLSITACLITATLGIATIAVAGGDPDDNDYEGRANKNDATYFGFDLSNDGKTVKNITGYFRFKCENGKQGSLAAQTNGSLKVKDGKFEGQTKGPSKGTMFFETTGKLGNNGKAKGTIEAELKISPTATCTARNDGEWSAKEGRDIDIPDPL